LIEGAKKRNQINDSFILFIFQKEQDLKEEKFIQQFNLIAKEILKNSIYSI
jgi:hypothetical protein